MFLLPLLAALYFKKVKPKTFVISVVVGYMFIAYLAINVGVRQENLGRERFDQVITETQIEKKQVTRYNAEKAQDNFEKTLKEIN
jgi:hypothetical protein